MNTHVATSQFSARSFLMGAVISLVIYTLFHNLQAISDAAPAAIKDSAMPGLLGLPIVIVTVVWMIASAGIFTRSIISNAMAMRGFVWPPAFWTGAFAVMAIYFGALKFLGA